MSLRPGPVILAVLATLLAVPAQAAKLVPSGGPLPVAVEISGKAYTYFPLQPGRAMSLAVDGPSVFEAITRWRFAEGEGPVRIELQVSVDGARAWREVLEARPGGATYPDMPGMVAGSPDRVRFELPSGRHTVELTLVSPSEGVLDVNPLSLAPDVLPWRVEWRLEEGLSYDSNIFRYGDPDIEGFQDGERPYRYGMDTLDDVRLEPSVDLSFVREEPRVRSTSLTLSADWRLATSNGEKSFSKLGARLREERAGVAFLSLDYYAIPSYHLRLLWDPDAVGGDGAYRSCDFRKHSFGVAVGSDRSLPVDVSGDVRFESYAYDPDFVEYDSVARTAGLTLTVRPARGLRLDARYALRSATARGSDEAGETRATSDDSDTTYDQDEYSLRARLEAGRWWGRRAVLSASVRHASRFYLTSKSGDSDPYHAGREDSYWVAGARLRLELTGSTGVEGFYQYRCRTVDSPFVEDIGDLKDYGAHRFGLLVYVERGRFLD